MNKTIIHILLCFFLVNALNAQTVENVLEIRDGSQFSHNLVIGKSIIDDKGNIYYIQSQPTYIRNYLGEYEMSDGGLWFEDEFIERGPVFDSIRIGAYYWYIIKFNAKFEYLKSTVIKNVRLDRYPPSISFNNNRLHLLINGQRGLDLMVGDSTMLSSSGYDTESWVLTFDTNLKLDNVSHFPHNKVEKICGANDEDEIYLGYSIKELDEFIIIDQDTIWNYILAGSSHISNNAVISKYNYKENRHQWVHRFGEFNGSKILDLWLDKYGDLIVIAKAAGYNVYIGEGIDTLKSTGRSIKNGVTSESVILKFSPDGGYEWGVTTPKGRWDIFRFTDIDTEGNIYVSAAYAGDTLFIKDTFFVFTMPEEIGARRHYVILKFNRNGEFDWGHQLAGQYNDNQLFVSVGSSNRVTVWGWFVGAIEIEDTLLTTPDPEISFDPGNYLYSLNQDGEDQKFLFHSIQTGPEIKDVIELGDEKSIWMVYPSEADSIFNHIIEEPRPVIFVRVSKDNVLSAENSQAQKGNALLKAYPNPVTESRTVYIDLNKKVTAEPTSIHLYNASGKMVLSSEAVIVDGTTQLELPQSMSSGTYFIRLVYGGKSAMGKLVVR